VRVVTVNPLGREIVGLFSAVQAKWYQIGFITRLRMGDYSWRPARKTGDNLLNPSLSLRGSSMDADEGAQDKSSHAPEEESGGRGFE